MQRKVVFGAWVNADYVRELQIVENLFSLSWGER